MDPRLKPDNMYKFVVQRDKEKRRRDFLARKKVGMILRVYATEENHIPDRVAMVEEAVVAARKATVDGRQLIQRIDVLVWADKDYVEADCGQTAGKLRKKLRGEPNLFVSEVTCGDLYCGLLNYGISHQTRHGVDYSIIVSAEAFSYMTPETMSDMVDAACKGARAIGVAIKELTDLILAGSIANTFAMWHNESLMTVDGFDLNAAKPLVGSWDSTIRSINGFNEQENRVVTYHLAGEEEVIPLARMIRTFKKFGPCIAPILPRGKGVQRYQAPDPVKNPDLWLRHISKMGTKAQRQAILLALVNADLDFLKSGIMPEYRHKTL